MALSFDTISFFLTAIGLEVDGNFLCNHEADYVSKRLKHYYRENSNVNENEILQYARTIITDIENVLNHIRSTKWFLHSKEYVVFENDSYKYRTGSNATINLSHIGRDLLVPLIDYINMKEFAYYGYESANIDVSNTFIDFSFSFPIDFDEYIDKYFKKQKRNYDNVVDDVVDDVVDVVDDVEKTLYLY
jgi:hypothetical protein